MAEVAGHGIRGRHNGVLREGQFSVTRSTGAMLAAARTVVALRKGGPAGGSAGIVDARRWCMLRHRGASAMPADGGLVRMAAGMFFAFYGLSSTVACRISGGDKSIMINRERMQ